MTTTITEKRAWLITEAVNAASATIRPTSPRGVIPHPTARDSGRDIFESRAANPHPTTFVRIATTARTKPNRKSEGSRTAAGRSTWRPREMKKIGVKMAPRYPAPSVKSSRSGVFANMAPAKNAPTTAERPISSATNA